MRQHIQSVLERNEFTAFIAGLIVLNAIILGLETSPAVMGRYEQWLLLADGIILGVFTLEIIAKLYAYKERFFRSGWNLFDFSIVAVSLVPASGPLSILRAFRILRVLRLFSVVPQMRRVVDALFHAIPGMASVVGVLMIVFYVAAVLATKLFGVSDNPELQTWFGSVGASMYTLFQIMTLESWSMGIVRPTLELYPWAWVFFVPFIIVTSFAVLNLFIGIIVDSMQRAQHDEDSAEFATAAEERKMLEAKIDALQKHVSYLAMVMESRLPPANDSGEKPLRTEKDVA